MKLKSNLLPVNPRVLLALSLCVVKYKYRRICDCLFARPAANSEKKSGMAKPSGKSGSAMARKQTDRSRASKDTDRSGDAQAGKPEKATVSQERAPRISEQRNALGQTVYSVSASRFDVSAPLSELAKIKVLAPEGEDEVEINQLPAWMRLKSGQPDPVTQVVPSDTKRGPGTPTRRASDSTSPESSEREASPRTKTALSAMISKSKPSIPATRFGH